MVQWFHLFSILCLKYLNCYLNCNYGSVFLLEGVTVTIQLYIYIDMYVLSFLVVLCFQSEPQKDRLSRA